MTLLPTGKQCLTTTGRKGEAENVKQYMDAQEVAEALGVSRSKAYVIIKQLNDELQKKGFLTVRGKVSRKFFQERTYGKVSEDENTRRN